MDNATGCLLAPLLNGSAVTFANTADPLSRMCEDNESPMGGASANQSTVPALPLYVKAVSTLFYVVIFLLGTLGNSLVVAAVALHKDMRTVTNVFLVNLALADLLVILICMPTALVDIYSDDQWHFGAVMCKLVPILENAVAHASVLTMLVIAAERLLAICWPLKFRYMMFGSRKAKMTTVALVWLLAFLAALPFLPIAVYRDSQYRDKTPIKVCRTTVYLSWQKGYVVTLCVAFFLVPCLILFTLYLIIGRELSKEGPSSGIPGSPSRSSSQQRGRQQVVVMLVIMTIAFFILHLPFRVLILCVTFAPRSLMSLGLEGWFNLLNFTRVMFYLNSCVNPVVYTVFSSKFRLAFRRMLCGRRGLRQRKTMTEAANSSLRQTDVNHSVASAGAGSVKKHDDHSAKTLIGSFSHVGYSSVDSEETNGREHESFILGSA